MQAFSAKLRSDGYEVEIIRYSREQTITEILKTLTDEGFDTFHVCELYDFLLEKRIRRFVSDTDGINLKVHDSPMFVTPQDWANNHFDSRKKPFMAKFYEAQRQRMNVLVDADGNPTGGQWSFDEDNRKPMPKRGSLDIPPDPSAPPTDEVKAIIREVGKAPEFSDYPGNEKTFYYPTTHEAAEKWFTDFLTKRFDRFGPYEDAVAAHERVLFHSVLTPMMNIGLLTPDQVLQGALEFAEDNGTSLNSLEGFVRQIIGWREFMCLMYARHGVEMRNLNFFNHDRDIPRSFWTGDTGITPIDTTIQRIHDHAYAHHIERLMLMGNFMLLCRFDPVQVNDWFMELFIDAYDWVMVPNVFGMSQFADGGIFTTKPYISGHNYVCKMSDYKKGDWCEIWDGLFWSFIAGNDEFFRRQYRLSMMVRNLDKMDHEKKSRLFDKADAFLNGL